MIRKLLALAAFAAGSALAQSFPSKPVHVIVPFPPGGGADALARIMGPHLTKLWGQPVIVENRPGASGHIGADVVANSPPDGYTLLMSSTASLTEKNVGQFAPVTLVSASPYVITVNPKVPAASVRELIDYARKNPGKLTFGSSGTGAASAPFRRALQVPRRRRDAARAVQGHGPGRDRPPRRADRRDVRAGADRDAARGGGKAQGARGHEREALGHASRASDGGGVGTARV
jgi:hypothetical protein